MEPTRDDLIYFAAAVDFDGCISHTTNDLIPLVNVSNLYRPLLEVLKSYYGGSIQEATGIPSKRGTTFSWTICGKDTPKFLQAIKPFLRIKRKQAELALVLASTVAPTGGKRLPDDVWILRSYVCDKLNKLNREVPT